MSASVLLFSIGLSLVCWLPVLPEISALWWFVLALPLGLVAPRTLPVLGLLVGFAFGVYEGQRWIDQKVPKAIEGATIWVELGIQSSPEKRGEFYRFRATVLSGELSGRHLQLVWLGPDPPTVGEVWRAPVKLYRPRGTVNPGLFDYEAWLLSAGIHGLGYVTPNNEPVKLRSSSFWFHVQRLRDELRDEVLATPVEPNVQGALLALLIGNSGQLSTGLWQNLSRTGTNHLFVVSGLHVGLVSAGLLMIFKRLSIRRYLVLGLMLACLSGYCVIVGFGLPVQRALIMVVFALLLAAISRDISVWRVFLFALAGVLIVNPFASLTPGFWLSFGAVAGLMAAFLGWQTSTFSSIHLALRTQWVALIVTAPLLLLWIGQFSLTSIIANTMLIPLMGLFVVPLIMIYLATMLLGLVSVSAFLMQVLVQLVTILLWLIQLLADHSWVVQHPLSLSWMFAMALLGSLIMLLPNGLVPRWLAVFCWLPVLQLAVPERESSYIRVDVLDVGQGLSVVVTAPQSTLVYDTGSSYSRSDAGQQILIPMLRQLRRDEVDLLVTSHGDDDHSGGTRSTMRQLPVQFAVSSDPNFGSSCADKKITLPDFQVEWFAALLNAPSRNDSSCVVTIRNRYAEILLAGDIEHSAEKALLSRLSPVDLLVSPHHGSSSSSTPGFINRVAPDWVVHSTGYLNRFGHPHDIVRNRYQSRGVRQFNTAVSGSVSFLFTAGSVEVTEARRSTPRFWYDAAPRWSSPES